MPDLNGILSQSEKETIIKWVTEKKSTPRSSLFSLDTHQRMQCQLCAGQAWTVAECLVTPTVVNATGVGLLSPYFPQAMLVCNDCGNTLYINVHRLGLIKG